MAVDKKVTVNTPFKDAVAKKGGGLGSPAPIGNNGKK
jgi:hypothetical protein